MTVEEACGQAFENGRKVGYEEGKRDAVKHGRWLDGNGRQPCSACHFRGMKSWNYCPHCGARMDGDGHA